MSTSDQIGIGDRGSGWKFFGRFISWRAGRRLLVALALVGTLVAVVYVVEDWRGRRAWDRCRRELEARGEKLDWEAFVPASVPTESNFFKAPGMTAWFSKQASATNRNVRLFSVTPSDTRGWPLTLEELRALPEDRVSGSTNNLSRAELRERFAELETEYKTLAVACARAQSRLGDDYRVPLTVDIPNFARARSAAQSLSVHANLNLLDERPDVALADLAMMRRLADAMAENQTLVGTMIGVAIMGLHVETARAALDAGLWKEPQLAAIQAQILDFNLLGAFARSIRWAERAGGLWLLERPRTELEQVLNLAPLGGGSPGGINWSAAFTRLGLRLCPRGWIRQNQATLARSEQDLLDGFDPALGRIHARRLTAVGTDIAERNGGFTPYGFLAAMATPNFIRALQTLARIQTQIDQLEVACALERHRLAHGSYPEKLELLAPAYLNRVPGDLFADRTLQYTRDGQGQYRLWSVGWNEKDDGGLPSLGRDGKPDYGDGDGDWVWTSKRP